MFDRDFIDGVASLRQLMGPKWGPHVLRALADGPRHFTELHADLQPQDDSIGLSVGVPNKSLCRTLDELEANRLVNRDERVGSFPPSVTYSLTPAGEELLDTIEHVALLVSRRACDPKSSLSATPFNESYKRKSA